MSEQQTPEEIAAQIMLGYQSSYDACKDDILSDDIAAAIRAAVSSEREACAKVAEASRDIVVFCNYKGVSLGDGAEEACAEIAAAIRARAEAQKGE